MNYWLVSDTHFNHEKLTEWGGRTGDWEAELIAGLAKIPAGDTLIHLGDICIGNDGDVHQTMARSLLGVTKILVRGNHDKKGVQWYTEHCFDFVCDGFELIYQGHYLHFTHRPARPQGATTFNIHGHTHGNLHRSEESADFYSKDYHIDISPELVGFKPIRLDLLLRKQRNAQLQKPRQSGEGQGLPV